MDAGVLTVRWLEKHAIGDNKVKFCSCENTGNADFTSRLPARAVVVNMTTTTMDVEFFAEQT